MPLANLRTNGDVAGIVFRSTIFREADGAIGHGPITLPAALAGTLTTRSTDTTGVITSADHTIEENDKVDIYWAGGRRYDVDVDSVTASTITFSGGAGDNLSAQTTALTVVKQTVIDTDWDGDLTEAIAALAGQRAHISIRSSAGTQKSVDLNKDEMWSWAKGGDVANPLDSVVVDEIAVSQASAAVPAEFKIGVIYDSTV